MVRFLVVLCTIVVVVHFEWSSFNRFLLQEQRLAESMNKFVSHTLETIKQTKDVYPPSTTGVPEELCHMIR